MRILACQTTIPRIRTPEERDQHVARVLNKARARLRENDCDLVLFPELFTIDYSRDTFAALDQLGEDLNGPTVTACAMLAQEAGRHVGLSLPRRIDNKFYISFVVLAPDGSIAGTYEKLHIAEFGASQERDYFERGNSLLVFECGGMRCSSIICYDFRFPELIRHLCLKHRVDVILHPVAFERDTTFASWEPFVICRALENQVFFLSLNRAGQNYGHSLLCPPWIDEDNLLVRFPADEHYQLLELNQQRITDCRKEFPFREDFLGEYQNLKKVGEGDPG